MSLWCGSAAAWAEPLAVIVNNNNPVTSLTKTNIAAMYRGEELHWAHGGRIKLVNREISSDIREHFYKKILNARSDQQFLRPGTPVAVQSLIQRSDEAVIRFVSAIEGAIGYVNLSSVKDGVKVVFILREKAD
ncbi:MAG: substrate-binding domain-containing protein [Nitrospirota bacterium]|nr:substrate-binding domain-containing protein [Nitrospirota bacterium]